MRRLALITDGGHISHEGVNIEGECILRTVHDGKIVTLKESQLKGYADKRFLFVKYQDPNDEEAWEPRAEA